MFPKKLSGDPLRPIHFHVHNHTHKPKRHAPKAYYATQYDAPKRPSASYRNIATQVDTLDLPSIPFRAKLSRAWVTIRPAALWFGEAAVFLLSRISFGFGYGVNYMPFLGLNANNRTR